MCANFNIKQSLSVRCVVLTSPQKGQTVVLVSTATTPLIVFGSFGVVMMSCKVNFHVVRSALQPFQCVYSVSIFTVFLLVRSFIDPTGFAAYLFAVLCSLNVN